jgi:hypothetical protein
VWACLPPRNLDKVQMVAVSRSEITLKWAQPKFTSSCTLTGFKLYMNDGQGGDTFT